VDIVEVDFGTAPDTVVEEWRTVENAALAVDLPDDPPYLATGFRELRNVVASRVQVTHLAATVAGQLVGTLRFRLHAPPNQDFADAAIVVRPDHRRRGIGSALLEAAVELAENAGATSLSTGFPDAAAGGAGAIALASAHGFSPTLREVRSLQPIAAARVHQELAARRHPPYRLVHHAAGLPEELFEPFVAARNTMREAPPPKAGFDLGGWSVADLRSMFDAGDSRGETLHAVCALFEEPSGVAVAAMTLLVVSPTRPTRAQQADTVVVPQHRGRGLGLWVKANAALIVADQHPQVVEVETWNALENVHMLQVNAALGYCHDREWQTWSRDLS
jgi:GNAT superfamily N-acetyltransferase